MRKLHAVGLALSALGAAGFAAPSPPPCLSGPIIDTTGAFTAEGKTRAFPKALLKAAKPGVALVQCEVSADQHPTNCAILGETPKGKDVGATAVKLLGYSKVAKETPDGLPTAGGYLTVPFYFHMTSGVAWSVAQTAAAPFILGDAAYVVTRTPIGQPSSMAACPTDADPNGRCYLHRLGWQTSVDATGPLVRKLGRTSGKSSLNCGFDADRHLIDCTGSDDLKDPEVAALQAALASYTPRITTLDSVLVANTRMVVFFDWAELATIAGKSARCS